MNTNNYLTAKQAGKISEENNKNLIKVLDKIKSRAKDGYNFISGEQLTMHSIDTLRNLGYDVEYEETTEAIGYHNGKPIYITSIESEIKW